MFCSMYDILDVMLKDAARLSIACKVYASSGGSVKQLDAPCCLTVIDYCDCLHVVESGGTIDVCGKCRGVV